MDEESEYFYQLIRFVVDLGTETLLKILQKQVPNGQTLDKFIKSKQSTIRALEKGKVLNDMQMKVLNATTIDNTKLDISLLFTLLRNLTTVQPPNAGWEAKSIASSEVSTGAFLVRLKNVRNEAIAHKAQASLTEIEFEKFWKETEQCLIGLAREISPEVEHEVSEKIGKLKVKSVDLNDNPKLDKLLKWYFEENSAKMEEMANQMKDIHSKIDNQPDVSSELRDIQKKIDLIQKEVKSLSLQKTMASNLPSFPSQTFSEGSTVSDGNGSKEVPQIQAAVNEIRSYFKMMMCMYTGEVDPGLDQVDGSGYRNPNAFTDDEIKEYSEELGAEWEIFAIYLGYRQQQIDHLKDTYPRQIETLLLTMLRKWHNEVAGCENENPRDLLAAAFVGIRDNLTASKILGGRERLPEMKKLKPKPETAKKIKQIKFATKPTAAFATMLQMGAMGAGAISYPTGQIPLGYSNAGQNNATRYEPYTAKTKKNFPYWRNQWKQDSSAGNFQYFPQDSGVRLEGVDVGKLKQLWQESVCQIIHPNGRGSGFRIGPPERKYICTARHVVTEMINSPRSLFEDQTISLSSPLSRHQVYCVFNHTIDDYFPEDRFKFYFKAFIHFEDEETDTAILELEDNAFGTPLPQPFAKFVIPDPTHLFHLIGHPGGGKKIFCKSENIIDMIYPDTSNHINKVRRWCEDNNFACEPSQHNRLDNPARWLFHVASGFTKGASGCPGLVIRPPDDVMVVTVLLRGYPDGYYDEKLAPGVRNSVPKDFLVEQGANMEFVVKNMYAKAPQLCAEIFNYPVN